jgi:hypothetical protein
VNGFHHVARVLVRQRCHPTAVLEAAVAVLVGGSPRLTHSVERHELGHDEVAHGLLLVRLHAFLWLVSGRQGTTRGRCPGRPDVLD